MTDRENDLRRQLEMYGTLGPSCASREILRKIFAEGITGMRLNLSHTTLADSEELIGEFHAAAAMEGVKPSLLIDMQGPELRVGKLTSPIELREGDTVSLVPDSGEAQDQDIPVPENLLRALSVHRNLLLDDGKITLETERVAGGEDLRAWAAVKRGGILHSRKSVAAPGLSIRSDTLTGQDIMNLRMASSMGVTEVMQPFVRGAADLVAVRKAMKREGAGGLGLFAKIENREGALSLEEIIPHADMIVIARGDLGNALPLSRLPVLQHYIAQICRSMDTPFMVVTQMLASMERSAVPTRAEVSDIYRAVSEGAGAVMITGETASGSCPVEASRYLVRTALEAQKALHGHTDAREGIRQLFEKERLL